MANVVYTGFDPEFGNPLDQLIARAKAEGYAPELISGRRDAYGWPGMKGQSQAELYGQLGKPGGPAAAAPPGYSPHQYGVAADVTGIPQSELARLAPQLGLNTIPGDPGHVELANWRQTAATQPPVTPWSEVNPANVPSRMAMNVGDASAPGNGQFAPPGTSLNSAPDRLASMVRTLESGGGRYSSAQPKSMVDPLYGQYPGFAKSYGRGAAGVDNYAQAVLAANPKASVGDFYAGYFSGTGPPGSAELQQFQSAVEGRDSGHSRNARRATGGGCEFRQECWRRPEHAIGFGRCRRQRGGPGPGNVGPVTGFLPGQSTGQGPIGSDVVASKDAGAPAAPSIASQIAGPLQSLTKGLEDSGQQQQQSGDQGAQQSLQAQQAAAAYGQQRQMALQQQAMQLMAATMARGQKGLSWGSSPPGAVTGLQRSPMTTEMWGGIPIPMPGPTPSPGMTLNSMGDPNYG